MTPTHAQFAELCAEVLALSDKATPGPWDTEAVFGERHWDVVLNYPTPIEGSPVVVASTYGEDGRMPSEEGASYNARFIAAAPRMAQCIRELLAERTQLHAVIAELVRLKRLKDKSVNQMWTLAEKIDYFDSKGIAWQRAFDVADGEAK